LFAVQYFSLIFCLLPRQKQDIFILDILLCSRVLQISMQLMSTQLFIIITDISSDYMVTCFHPHLHHLQANIKHQINYGCLHNLHVDRVGL